MKTVELIILYTKVDQKSIAIRLNYDKSGIKKYVYTL